MKKLYFTIITLFFANALIAQPQTVTYSISPAQFEENQSITVTFNGSSINEATWGVTGNALYLWAWSFNSSNTGILDCPTNGAWTASNAANALTYNAGTDTYSITFVPQTFYSRTGIGRIGFLLKAFNATGDKKSQDITADVGLFQFNLVAPLANSSTIINSGSNLNISANNSNGNAAYNLKANGVSINSVASATTFSFNHTNITANQSYELDVTQGMVTKTKKFNVIVVPTTVTQTLPAGLEDGINYNPTDPTKATLVLDALGKDFVYVAGSFNDWKPNNSYAMKKDGTSSKFWLELTGLVSGTNYTYQYWVVDQTPIANSPVLVKTADPYSSLVLSPFDDPYISATTYPGMPVYPVGQEREVTVLKTGQTPYVWSSATTGFVKPKKEDLVVYEVLIRDFDANRNIQSLIDRIDYFKNLKINAIQLMPIMEFEGNESWGYNTSFHLALDKFYGTEAKMREFVELCHANGIAVILDVALNHAFGRNPMNRMWMNDVDGDGWGEPASDNPYFNQIATHSYSVGSDFNHQQSRTQYYTRRVIKRWIEEFKIDGFRWDLTKGFTQNCQGNDGCTNSYQQDRVDVLKNYADYSWSLDPYHYAIFEHLGSDGEEKVWADYRLGDAIPKGIMMWGEMNYQYSQLMSGYATDGVITRMGSDSRGFNGKRLIGYSESHDKDRLMYNAMTYGNAGGSAPPLNNLNNSLARMSAIGAASILIPGPKMLWHFSSLGMQDSIWTCNNGTVNTDTDPFAGDCKLDSKPQPQWTNNWLAVAQRNKIYNDWAKLISLKINEPVFEASHAISPDGSNVKQRIYIFDNSIPTTSLRNVVVLCNFSVANLSMVPSFPYTGTWYNLMDNTQITVTDVNATLAIPSGQFLIYGNRPAATLANEDFIIENDLFLSPNPTNSSFTINANAAKINIYSITGQLVKQFNGSFDNNYNYNIEDLTKGIYLVKVIDNDNNEKSLRLIKQ